MVSKLKSLNQSLAPLMPAKILPRTPASSFTDTTSILIRVCSKEGTVEGVFGCCSVERAHGAYSKILLFLLWSFATAGALLIHFVVDHR